MFSGWPPAYFFLFGNAFSSQLPARPINHPRPQARLGDGVRLRHITLGRLVGHAPRYRQLVPCHRRALLDVFGCIPLHPVMTASLGPDRQPAAVLVARPIDAVSPRTRRQGWDHGSVSVAAGDSCSLVARAGSQCQGKTEDEGGAQPSVIRSPGHRVVRRRSIAQLATEGERCAAPLVRFGCAALTRYHRPRREAMFTLDPAFVKPTYDRRCFTAIRKVWGTIGESRNRSSCPQSFSTSCRHATGPWYSSSGRLWLAVLREGCRRLPCAAAVHHRRRCRQIDGPVPLDHGHACHLPAHEPGGGAKRRVRVAILRAALDTVIAPLLFSFAGTKDRDTLKATGIDRGACTRPRRSTRSWPRGVTSYVFQHREYTPSTYSDIVYPGRDHGPGIARCPRRW